MQFAVEDVKSVVDMHVASIVAVLALCVSASAKVHETAVEIDTGRQLFVDDFLVQSSDGVERHWNRPVKIDEPIVWPGGGAANTGAVNVEDEPVNVTCATDGGLWWDPVRQRFRLWYQAGWCGDICYAESRDGLDWKYPDLGIVKGTNRLFENDNIDSWCVSPDYAAKNPYSAWNLHISAGGNPSDDSLWVAADGVHFKPLGVAGRSGDRSTMYYDPFRSVWVFSLRDNRANGIGRCRSYFASPEFGGERCRWRWTGFTRSKGRDGKETHAGGELMYPEQETWLVATNGPRRSLYSFSAVAYESVMLGVMEILYGNLGDNGECSRAGLPKQTYLHFCFSRDGKTYEPREEADIAPSGWGSGKWDTGYLSVVGGICVIKDERLWFYYSGLRGDSLRLGTGRDWARNGMYSNGSIGAATLRRDGFAGMVADGRGEIVTKPVVFSGKHLFVNAECRFGSVAAEVVGEDGKVVPGFSRDDCAAFSRGDSTKTELRFRGGDLSALAGKPVRFRFLIHCGTLYSFWVSPSGRGESRGYVAAGGPAYKGLRDF